MLRNAISCHCLDYANVNVRQCAWTNRMRKSEGLISLFALSLLVSLRQLLASYDITYDQTAHTRFCSSHTRPWVLVIDWYGRTFLRRTQLCIDSISIESTRNANHKAIWHLSTRYIDGSVKKRNHHAIDAVDNKCAMRTNCVSLLYTTFWFDTNYIINICSETMETRVPSRYLTCTDTLLISRSNRTFPFHEKCINNGDSR